jgi:uncharacterized membrane protein
MAYNRYYQTLILFVLLDSLYLYLMRNYFDDQIRLVQGSSIQLNLIAAILCYLVLTFGLYYFIIQQKKPLFQAFLLGFVIYGTYELTTLSLLKKWKPQTVVIDTLWGSILFTIVAFIINKLY